MSTGNAVAIGSVPGITANRPWAASTALVADEIRRQGVWTMRNTGGARTTAATFTVVEAALWQVMSQDSVPNWATSTIYPAGAEINLPGVSRYVCLTAHTSHVSGFANDVLSWTIAATRNDTRAVRVANLTLNTTLAAATNADVSDTFIFAQTSAGITVTFGNPANLGPQQSRIFRLINVGTATLTLALGGTLEPSEIKFVKYDNATAGWGVVTDKTYSSDKLSDWSASTAVRGYELRTVSLLGGIVIIRSGATRTTGATFDATEAANWSIVAQTNPGTWAVNSVIMLGLVILDGGRRLRWNGGTTTTSTVDIGADASWVDTDTVSSSVVVKITGIAHGFIVGDAVYKNSFSGWAKAIATARGTLAHGVVSRVISTTSCEITLLGEAVNMPSFAAGPIYLSAVTAGLITTTAPATGFVQIIGNVTSSPNTWVVKPSGGIPALPFNPWAANTSVAAGEFRLITIGTLIVLARNNGATRFTAATFTAAEAALWTAMSQTVKANLWTASTQHPAGTVVRVAGAGMFERLTGVGAPSTSFTTEYTTNMWQRIGDDTIPASLTNQAANITLALGNAAQHIIMNQTTAARTITISLPTVNGMPRTFTVTNIGTASVTVVMGTLSKVIPAGATALYPFNGTSFVSLVV